MAPSCQESHQNPSGDSLNDSQIISGSHEEINLVALFAPKNLERLFDAERTQNIFDSLIEEFAIGVFMPALALAKSKQISFLHYLQRPQKHWHNPNVIPERLKVKIRCTIKEYVHQLFGVLYPYPLLVGEHDKPNQDNPCFKSLDWEIEKDILPVLETLSNIVTKDSFVDSFAAKIWFHTILLSQNVPFSEFGVDESCEMHIEWENMSNKGLKVALHKFAELKISRMLNESFGNVPDEIHHQQEIEVSANGLAHNLVIEEFIDDGREAVEVLERQINQRLDKPDKRKNESYVYLVKWREGENEFQTWVHYNSLTKPELVLEFKRRRGLTNKKSPKRLQRTLRV